MCARLKVLVSSRHSGPAFIAVSTSSMAEKAVPISAAEVSIPGFAIRFNDIALRLSDRTVARQLIPRAHYICGIAHIIRVSSAHWRQPGGMICRSLDSH